MTFFEIYDVSPFDVIIQLKSPTDEYLADTNRESYLALI